MPPMHFPDRSVRFAALPARNRTVRNRPIPAVSRMSGIQLGASESGRSQNHPSRPANRLVSMSVSGVPGMPAVWLPWARTSRYEASSLRPLYSNGRHETLLIDRPTYRREVKRPNDHLRRGHTHAIRSAELLDVEVEEFVAWPPQQCTTRCIAGLAFTQNRWHPLIARFAGRCCARRHLCPLQQRQSA